MIAAHLSVLATVTLPREGEETEYNGHRWKSCALPVETFDAQEKAVAVEKARARFAEIVSGCRDSNVGFDAVIYGERLYQQGSGRDAAVRWDN